MPVRIYANHFSAASQVYRVDQNGLTPALRGRVAREIFGIVRGSTITRWRDDTTIAAIVVAACNVAKVPVQSPAYAVLAEVEFAAAGDTDDLDLWAEDRDQREDSARSARYVSRSVVGYEELDGYGDWVVDDYYGPLWTPRITVVDWAPYRFGYWTWIGPWGWTWIDNEPWGFAPCHYGRWVHARHGWAWAPGADRPRRPVFAPALVGWHDGHDRDHDRDYLRDRDHPPRSGWVPLGYNEAYAPPFRTSRDYLRAANATNTRLDRDHIDRWIDRRQHGGEPERRFVNEGVPGAVTLPIALPNCA